MKTKSVTITLAILTSVLAVFLFPLISNHNQILANETEFPSESQFPGRIEDTGTYFEIKDSEYLNITLKSTEGIKVILGSIPRMISLDIASSTDSTSTFLTLEGLELNKTYYKYQDSYKNEVVFSSNENGSYNWTQDLSQSHHIWFQEIKGTVFLPEDCSKYGIWDATSSVCTLNQDLTQSVEITANNITLDCNSHKITGKGSGYGIYLNKKSGIAFKNCNINNFPIGIYLWYSNDNIIIDNSLSTQYEGIYLYSSDNNGIKNNVAFNNKDSGILLEDESNSNFLTNNTLRSNYNGITLRCFRNKFNTIADNSIVNNYGNGIVLGCSSYNIIKNNEINRNFRHGLYFGGGGADNNVIVNNHIANNLMFGIGFSISNHNRVHHNNFVNNHQQVYIDRSLNPFDDGYPSGGNYWSDYIGVDLYSGSNQNEPGSDGIGDTPYTFYGGQDRYPFMKENGWEVPEKWSFALITDLHIGKGYPDYDGIDYENNGEGEDYYLTERLKKVVDWIIENRNKIECGDTKCPIQFLAVLGDTADTAEKSEFQKARQILDKLNDPNRDGNTSDGIPYLPVFGNHDVWPYTDKEEADYSQGEQFFDEIFWNENATNTKLLIERLNFQRDDANPKYKNFAFNYREMNFVGLDFVERNPTPFGSGVGADAVLGDENENWLKFRLEEFKENPVVIFSHHPFVKKGLLEEGAPPGAYYLATFEEEDLNKIKQLIDTNVLANFAGHIHGFEKFLGLKDVFFPANWEYPAISTTQVITTEALMVAGNEKDISNKGIIRIVKVNGNNEIDYSTTEGIFPALNPYISWAYKFLEDSSNPCVFFKSHPFTHREISSYQWQFGDGIIDYGEIIPLHCYSEPGIYNVTSTLTDTKTGTKEAITRKIEIKEGLISKIIKIKDELLENAEIISQKIGEDLLKFGNYLIKGKDALLLKVKHSLSKPVGEIMVDFDAAEGDIDLSEMIFDTDTNKKKSILYMSTWPKVVEKEKILFIPK